MHPVPFDAERTGRALVDVVPQPRDRGMGVRLGEYIVTACHCLPRSRGRVVLPNPDMLGTDGVLVRVEPRGEGEPAGGERDAELAVLFADPCADLAVLSTSTHGGSDVPKLGRAQEFIWSLEAAEMERKPPHEPIEVFIRAHDHRWLRGQLDGAFYIASTDADRIMSGTSGAPVFTRRGRVVAIVGSSNIDGPDARVALLHDSLPGRLLAELRNRE